MSLGLCQPGRRGLSAVLQLCPQIHVLNESLHNLLEHLFPFLPHGLFYGIMAKELVDRNPSVFATLYSLKGFPHIFVFLEIPRMLTFYSASAVEYHGRQPRRKRTRQRTSTIRPVLLRR